jgi:hypothetical protein
MTEATDAALAAALQAVRVRLDRFGDDLDRLEARLAAVESRSERLDRLEAVVSRVAGRLNLDDNRQ